MILFELILIYRATCIIAGATRDTTTVLYYRRLLFNLHSKLLLNICVYRAFPLPLPHNDYLTNLSGSRPHRRHCRRHPILQGHESPYFITTLRRRRATRFDNSFGFPIGLNTARGIQTQVGCSRTFSGNSPFPSILMVGR